MLSARLSGGGRVHCSGTRRRRLVAGARKKMDGIALRRRARRARRRRRGARGTHIGFPSLTSLDAITVVVPISSLTIGRVPTTRAIAYANFTVTNA